jgi:transcriptional regulator with XRE-family HTH domain
MKASVLNSARIHERRKELGFTVDQLAAKVSEIRGSTYGRSCLSRTLAGTTPNPGADVVQALAVALQLPADDILSIETARRVAPTEPEVGALDDTIEDVK